MPLIDEFIDRYRKELDFYDQAARLVMQSLDGNLRAGGIRAIVTSRAKSIVSLEAKVRDRNSDEKYASIQAIYDNIVDLAGVRVALYFPGERSQVDQIIRSSFRLIGNPREFPRAESSKPKRKKPAPTYKKRFAGYVATHYHVNLKESTLSDAQKRYGEARVEVQVASVLMHAWSEVEHDLAYKPHQGLLSEEEYAILDELNGLVLAGEIALERLQKAGERRVADGTREFRNHYDLAANLLASAGTLLGDSVAETGLGRIDILYDLLCRLRLATPDSLKPYTAALHADIDRRPLSEQIIDQLLADDPSRYDIYKHIRESRPDFTADRSEAGPGLREAMGLFLASWISFEKFIRQKAERQNNALGYRSPFTLTLRVLDSLADIDENSRGEIDRIRRLRNNLVHGIETPSPSDLRLAAIRLESIIEHLRKSAPRPDDPPLAEL